MAANNIDTGKIEDSQRVGKVTSLYSFLSKTTYFCSKRSINSSKFSGASPRTPLFHPQWHQNCTENCPLTALFEAQPQKCRLLFVPSSARMLEKCNFLSFFTYMCTKKFLPISFGNRQKFFWWLWPPPTSEVWLRHCAKCGSLLL